MGTAATPTFSDNFADLSNWPTQIGSPSVAANVLSLGNSAGIGSSQSFSGALEVSFTVQLSGAGSQVQLGYLGGGVASDLSYGALINDTSAHSVRIVFDGSGSASTYLDGSGSVAQTMSGLTDNTGLVLQNTSGGTGKVSNFAVTTGASTASETSTVATATDLGTLDLADVTDAIQQVATLRATNGSEQSRFQFADEVLRVNKANIEAANSRLSDVDVAEESTTLARYNILVQSGTAMLSQANQSAQMALKLLG
ncbi:MAG: flagellin [Candidatus Didemnitutus sp.]|nr:flagellin [Candidatus Didemnitutus sp.]